MSENYNHPNSASHSKELHYSPNLLNTIDNAVNNRKVAIIEYDSFAKGVTQREVEPLAVIFQDKKRHLVAWCRLRNDYRSFRLDRLNCIRLTNEEFEKREDFNLEEFKASSQESYRNEPEKIN